MFGWATKQTTTTTGTGNLTLSSVSGFPTINDVIGLNRKFPYTLLNSSGEPVEYGLGYLSASTTLVRETVRATYVSSTYDDSSPTAANLTGTTTVVMAPGPWDIQGAIPYAHGRVITGTFRGMPSEHLGNPLVIAGNTHSNDFLYALPYLASCGGMVDSCAMKVSTAGTGTAPRTRVALCENTPTGVPGQVICEFTAAGGSPLDVSTTGWKVSKMTNPVPITPRWYWTVVITDADGGTGPTFYGRQYEIQATPFFDGGFNNHLAYASKTYGALSGDLSAESWVYSTGGLHTPVLGNS